MLAEYARRFSHLGPDNKKQWCPYEPTPKQREFLSLKNFEALYGGSAGGGKSICLLMAALDYVHYAQYRALIIRRTYKDLALAGALMDVANDWLSGGNAKWNGQDKSWEFPSGAVLQFGYMETERDKYRYQGSQYHFVGFDELTQLTESQYTYLLSRIRKTMDDPIPLRSRSASNPGNIGHKWTKKRFVDPITRGERAYVPAQLDDNPHLNAEEYGKALAELDTTTYNQLRWGVWLEDESLIIYPYNDAINGFDDTQGALLEMPDAKFVLGIDFGASTKKATTAFTLSAFSFYKPDLVVGIESVAFGSMIPSTIAEKIKQYQHDYDLFKIVGDAGALGLGYIEEFKRRHAIPIEPAKKQDKRGYIRLMRGALEQGKYKISRHGCAGLIAEFNTLVWADSSQTEPLASDGSRDPDNHLSDSALYSWRECRYWQAREPEIIPEYGTPQHSQWEADKMRAEAERRSADNIAQQQRRNRRRS